MHPATAFILLIAGILGHIVLWVGLVSRIHACNWPRWLIDALTGLFGLILVGPFAVALWLIGTASWPQTASGLPNVVWIYTAMCALFAVWAAGRHIYVQVHPERRGGLLANHTTQLDLRRHTGGPFTAPGLTAFLASLPGNEVLCPCFQLKEIAVPGLPQRYDGLKIVHLSDLHMSGRIAKQYFVEIVRRANQWEPAIIALTGDIVEREKCIDWIPDTLGQLRAQAGVFYVLGNHDRHVDCDRLRAVLVDNGLVDLGGRWQEVAVGETRIVLAGNELPWYAPAADLSACPLPDSNGIPPRIVLAHSPDQFAWAQENAVALMLAGHAHGGQVRFPLIGAVLAPCRYGTRYASGVFRAGGTVMHVSRGTSGLAPIRWNCPPEVTLLTLRAPPAGP